MDKHLLAVLVLSFAAATHVSAQDTNVNVKLRDEAAPKPMLLSDRQWLYGRPA